MALYREINLNEGNINDRFGAIGTVTGATFSNKEKGLAIESGTNTKYITYDKNLLPLTGGYSVVIWARINQRVIAGVNRTQVLGSTVFGDPYAISLESSNGSDGRPMLFVGGSNYKYFNYTHDKKWHCWIFTLDGTANSDINNANLYVDAVPQASGGVNSSGAPESRSGVNKTLGGITSNSFTSKIKVYDHVLSIDEINLEQREFNFAQQLYAQKKAISNKPSDLSHLKGSGAGQGLIAAYNMQKVGNTLVDISGNGNNGTISNGVITSKNGLQFNGINGTLGVANSTVNSFTTLSRIIILNGVGSKYVVSRGGGDWFLNTSGSNGFLFRIETITGGIKILTVHNLYSINTAFDVITTYDGANMKLYIDGVLVGTLAQTGTLYDTGNLYFGSYSGASGFCNVEYIDYREYNRVLTLQEIKDYHNQFVKPTLVENFDYLPCDGSSIVPTDWTKISGSFKGIETVIQQGSAYQSNFTTTDSWTAALGGSVAGGITIGGLTNCLEYTISGGSNFHVVQISPISTIKLGGRYTAKGKIYFPASGNANGFQIASTDGITVYQTFTPITKDAWYEFTCTYTAIGGNFNAFRVIPLVNGGTPFSNDGQKYYLKDIVVQEIPPLDTIQNGTKLLQCVTAGIIAIPNNIAYGSWEFDFYKGSGADNSGFSFISDKCAIITTVTGYDLGFNGSLQYRLNKRLSGSDSNLQLVNTLISLTTYYRIRIQRTTSGVFTVLIKGGSFVPTNGYDGWTLVSLSGGGGTNPTTDNTYTTSNYFVLNLGAGDRFGNLKITDGIKQL